MAVRDFRAAGPAALLLAAALLLTGCTGPSSGGNPAPTKPAGSSAATVPVAAGTATSYPVAASAAPSPLPVIGSRDNGKWTFTLNAVQQAGPGQLIVEGTLVSHDSRSFPDLAEPGYSLRKGTDGKLDSTYEFSAVTLTVRGDPTVYLPLRDAGSSCACTQGMVLVDRETPYAVYTMMTAPASASTVTIRVQSFAPFTNVPVTS